MTTVLSLLLLLFQFRPALPGYTYSFPRDHGSHNEFKIEWWYFTGHLDATGGGRFGFELTFFRTAMDRGLPNPSRWKIDHLYIAHFALTDITGRRFRFFEKVNRAGPGIAGADTGGLNVWNESWSARLATGAIQLNAAASDVKLELSLVPMAEPAIHEYKGS